jgi:hypothetical protein
MNRQTLLAVTGAVWLAAGVVLALHGAPPPRPTRAGGGGKTAQASDYSLSGPWTHDNLTIFLIRGEDRSMGKTFLVLQEALAAKKAIVHETEDVNLLHVENVSKDVEVFIQSGDIVKGGKQDRVIAFDLVLPPKSGRVPVIAYCVDQARWRQRGNEAVGHFGSSTAQLPSKPLKFLAGSYGQLGGQAGQLGGPGGGQLGLGGGLTGGQAGGRGPMGAGQFGQPGGQFGLQGGGGQFGFQGGVWAEVASVQGRLRKNAGAREAGSSLQLTLQDRKVEEAVGRYVRKLSPALEGQEGVVGFAWAVNGKVSGAEVYTSGELFRKLWPKLLKASAAEALAELRRGKPVPGVTAEDVRACFADAAKGKKVEKDITQRVRMVLRETDRNILLETQDREHKGAWVHRTYLTK